ncbi:MAG: hypothetical protein VX447_13500 [Pseudomonadota bacterium]|uniref:hypothetical protein n=1 Tax=Gallaecimonas pentaromativorans TaxID=584787 RepID=UPI00067ECEC4|nr:hypothetical protein [Gallaecimonas pentaromativorans]MED5525754.1 hypothetical protein [Pseudomonadota bacterium]
MFSFSPALRSVTWVILMTQLAWLSVGEAVAQSQQDGYKQSQLLDQNASPDLDSSLPGTLSPSPCNVLAWTLARESHTEPMSSARCQLPPPRAPPTDLTGF